MIEVFPGSDHSCPFFSPCRLPQLFPFIVTFPCLFQRWKQQLVQKLWYLWQNSFQEKDPCKYSILSTFFGKYFDIWYTCLHVIFCTLKIIPHCRPGLKEIFKQVSFSPTDLLLLVINNKHLSLVLLKMKCQLNKRCWQQTDSYPAEAWKFLLKGIEWKHTEEHL